MKKFIITVDTNWCGTEDQFGTEAESAEDLDNLADELAYDNFFESGGYTLVVEDLFPDAEEYTEEMLEEASEMWHECYSYKIEEFTGSDEEWKYISKV